MGHDIYPPTHPVEREHPQRNAVPLLRRRPPARRLVGWWLFTRSPRSRGAYPGLSPVPL